MHSDPTKNLTWNGSLAEDKKKSASALNELLHGVDNSDEEDLVGVEKVELRSSPRIAKQRSKVSKLPYVAPKISSEASGVVCVLKLA